MDWQVFRFLVGDQDVIAAIDMAAKTTETEAAEVGRQLKMDRSRLRLLDAAIWTYAKWSG